VEVPLKLSAPDPDRLVYAIPGWYRLAMALILAALGAGIALAGLRPGPMPWIVLGVVALGALYEERWEFDAGRGRIVHRAGLVFAPRRTVLPFAAIERLRLVPVVTGTVPGSRAEREENAAALAGQRVDDSGGRRQRHRKPFLDLVIESADGHSRLVDRMPARRAGRLRDLADRAAALCGKPLEEG
jgi:hypothetical protein